jgi:hypothetical protein
MDAGDVEGPELEVMLGFNALGEGYEGGKDEVELTADELFVAFLPAAVPLPTMLVPLTLVALPTMVPFTWVALLVELVTSVIRVVSLRMLE